METYRELVVSNNGMVASGHPLASWAGAKVLSTGGNAMDAAIATAAVTNVVIPHLCGLGGDAFILYYDSSQQKVTEFNGSGRAPLGAHREYFIDKGYKKMPLDGILSVSVPGQVSAMCAAHRYASKPLDELFSSAISYAENGFPVSEKTSQAITKHSSRLRKDREAEKMFFNHGKPLQTGEILVQKDLANTFKTIAKKGGDAFYRGELFEKIMEFSKSVGGLFEGQEWINHRTEVYEPIRTTYRGYEIIETTPPSQGYMVLEGLNVLEGFDIRDSLSTNAIHLMVEAKKRTFENRLKYVGEPFSNQLIKKLISKSHARLERKEIDLNWARNEDLTGNLLWQGEDTTYLTVVDKDGNAVSWIHSLSEDFGCGSVAKGTGVILNNRAGRGFSLVKDHPNVIAPGKKTMHTLNCWIALENGRPKWVGGTPGGDGQPQWNMQMLSHLIDRGMNPQQAVEAPRWLHYPGTDPETVDEPFELRMENRFNNEIPRQLLEKGHPVKMIGSLEAGGNAQIIEIDQVNGVLFGGSDPREDGMAIGL